MTFDEVMHKIEELRRHVKLVEDDLNARMAALEQKQHEDRAEAQKRADTMAREMAQVSRRMSNLESLVKATNMATLHLLGITARAVKVSEAEIQEAWHMAELVVPVKGRRKKRG